MSKPNLRLAFVDFWSGFNPRHNIVTAALEPYYNLQEDRTDPDFLFFSNYGLHHLQYTDCVKIFYTGENLAPDFNQCDYAVSACRSDFSGRNLYLPPCFLGCSADSGATLPPVKPEMAHRQFCSFIYSQDSVGEGSRFRRSFCEQLSTQYARVTCPGRVLHNTDAPELAARGDVDNWNSSKIAYLSKFKFNIAFENSNAPGYITEKLSDCFLGNTVPIYRGSCGNPAPFPKEAMICANDFPTTEALIARIREVNENDDLYLSILASNPFRHGMNTDTAEMLANYLLPILAKERAPFDKDVWHFGDAARLARLGHGASPLALHLRYLATCMGSIFSVREGKAAARQRRHELKNALRDLRQIQGR